MKLFEFLFLMKEEIMRKVPANLLKCRLEPTKVKKKGFTQKQNKYTSKK